MRGANRYPVLSIGLAVEKADEFSWCSAIYNIRYSKYDIL